MNYSKEEGGGRSPEKFLREAFGEDCIEKSSKVISLLMEHGIPVLYPDSRQRPAIYKAMEEYKTSTLEAIRAEVEKLKDNDNSDSKSRAYYNGLQAVIELLDKHLPPKI